MATENKQDSTISFKEKYDKVLRELDSLYRGTFDDDDATSRASLCLLAQADLLDELAATDLRSRALKRDIEFAKASAFVKVKKLPGPDGKKVTDAAAANLVLMDEEVQRISKEQTEAERDYKHLSNIHALLKEAHLTFRSIKPRITNG